MKKQISFIALGIVVATTALGFATVGRLPLSHPGESAQIRVADSAGSGVPRRVYCYNGIKGGSGNLYRGWVCMSEKPTIAN